MSDVPEVENVSPVSSCRPGWRLTRLEMRNWGTFHHKVHRLMPEGGWSLVVGENGSGKSTAIDALRTLLVPPRLLRLSYNDASTGGRGDRTRYTYVRGAWRSQGSDEAAQGTPEYLRGEGQHSTLLAVFNNEARKEAVSIAQILWLSGDKVDELFLIKKSDASIAGDLSGMTAGTSAEWKRVLTRDRGWEVRDEFTPYAVRFGKLLGIKGEGALEVFNQAIGVKNVGDINEFVRRHMLSPANAIEFVRDTLQPLYKELNDCYNAIQRARLQIAALEPIVAAHERKMGAQSKLENIKSRQQACPIFFTRLHRDLLLTQEELLNAELARAAEEKQNLESAAASLDETVQSLVVAISSNEVGKRIQELEGQIRQASRDCERIERRFKPWAQSLKRLAVDEPNNQLEFRALRELLDRRRSEADANLASAKEDVLTARGALREVEDEQKKTQEALDIARNRRVGIDGNLLRIRDTLCSDTGIEANSIPFAGELMEVKPEFREWTGAIERVLHGFAVSMLVPDSHYDAVARWINGRHLGLRFVFFRVHEQEAAQEPGGIHLRQGRLAGRLNYKHDHPLRHWVGREVARRFMHECCEDMAHLSRVHEGVTREGLVKQSGNRHIKDDRYRADDSRFWVLGWSAENKIRALLAALEDCAERKRECTLALEHAASCLKMIEDTRNDLTSALDVQLFEDIDWSGALRSLHALRHDLETLRQTDNEVKQLETRLATAKEELAEVRTGLEGLAKKAGSLEEKGLMIVAKLQSVTCFLEPFSYLDLSPYADHLRQLMGEVAPGLENVEAIAADVTRKLQGQANQQTAIINSANAEMGAPMACFLRDFPEYKGVLIDRHDYSEDFVAEHAKLKGDELPRHEERFIKLMDENLIGNIAHFSTLLKNKEEEARARIDQVNRALARIPYTPGTYVQIKTSSSPNREVGEFRARLRSCFDGGLHPSQELRPTIIERIRSMMEDLRTKEDWVRRVTDVREWLEFGVRELNISDNQEINYLTGSSGRSGGQKAKLAFTILASAITAQYGMADNPNDPDAFRLVLIDEVFSHTDEAYSRQALELFKSLGLQLIVVNPFDAKARIVERFVDSFHLTANPNRNDSRITRATRAEYEAARPPLLTLPPQP